jgi:hypothetical protein
VPPQSADGYGFQAIKKGLGEFNLRGVVLLDNQLTVDIFCNNKFISNV